MSRSHNYRNIDVENRHYGMSHHYNDSGRAGPINQMHGMPQGLPHDMNGGPGGPYDFIKFGTPSEQNVRHTAATDSISVTPDLLEKMYSSSHPKEPESGARKFGNPTPLSICGYIMALSPYASATMGWRSSGVSGIGTIGVYYFFGGILMLLGGILEFFCGQTFTFVVFCSFGAYWLSYGVILTPAFNAAGAYLPPSSLTTGGAVAFNTSASLSSTSTSTSTTPLSLTTPTFESTYGFLPLYMSLLCSIYLLCSLRSNLCNILIFLTLALGFMFETAQYWSYAAGKQDVGLRMQHTSGAFYFLACLVGWYVLLAQLLVSCDWPVNLPSGDTSKWIRGASERKKRM